MQQSGYHHAKSLSSQLRTELQIRDTDILSMVQTIRENTIETDPPSLANISTAGTSTITESLNIATQKSTQLEMSKLLRDLKSEFQGNNTEQISYSGGRSVGGRGNRNENGGRGCRGIRQNRKNPDNDSFPRPKIDKYCWTYGECNHKSEDCNRQAPGNKLTETFEDKQEGSKAHCEL